ncbi:hypothetical protein DBP19_36340 [Streptomyces sp. CS090A]|uniref:hypothetical protein n=1 Tax=Streptomyces sp. CS090A TaxID=2162710 RepID=UPI000D50657A|nr:hypothetical protein [Streptomyces sp. CS090A]PVC80610.1 hypothetical protein DBP19_36340 [Streptomyces sp. CS090A]
MIDRLPVTMALSALLTSATNLPVGRGSKPPTAPPPYFLLYAMPATLSGAPLADEHEDASFVYQVTSVSGPDPTKPDSRGVADQAEWMADKVRKAFLGRDPVTGLWLRPLTIPGAKVIARSLDAEAGGTNDPADAIMSYVQRFRFDLTPA